MVTTTSSSSSSQAITGIGNILKILPTGTVFLFQFLNPVVTNNGTCQPVNKWLTSILIAACGFACAFASFTDSYKDSNGSIRYGLVTFSGLWTAGSSSSPSGNNLSSYKLRVGDFVHALLAVAVFAVLALLDTNTVRCFYPSFESTEKTLLQLLPTVIGAVSTTVFALFPSMRHGIGYPLEETSEN